MEFGARGGGRTHTSRKGQGILSPPRMPFRHPGFVAVNLYYQKSYCNIGALGRSRGSPGSLAPWKQRLRKRCQTRTGVASNPISRVGDYCQKIAFSRTLARNLRSVATGTSLAVVTIAGRDFLMKAWKSSNKFSAVDASG
jgi:hypothetical protein